MYSSVLQFLVFKILTSGRRRSCIFVPCMLMLVMSIAQPSAAQSWSLTGNNATNPPTNFVGTKDNKALVFKTQNAERMRIKPTGQVGIGLTNPLSKLHIANGAFLSLSSPGYVVLGNVNSYNVGMGNDVIQARYNGNASTLYLNYYGGLCYIGDGVYATSTSRDAVYGYRPADSGGLAGVTGYNDGFGYGTSGFCKDGSGIFGHSSNYVGVWGETASPSSYAGFFAGDVYSRGNYLGSDQKLKENISEFSGAMETINKLHPKAYQYRRHGDYKKMNLPQGNHYGLIAQDVEQVLPNLVKEASNDPTGQNMTDSEIIKFKALNYTELIPIMIKGIQEQEQRIQRLEKMVQELGGNPKP